VDKYKNERLWVQLDFGDFGDFDILVDVVIGGLSGCCWVFIIRLVIWFVCWSCDIRWYLNIFLVLSGEELLQLGLVFNYANAGIVCAIFGSSVGIG